MSTQITAVFEGGLLRPTVPLSLPEGACVEVILVSSPARNEAARLLAEIATLPTEPGPDFSNRDHDGILYGKRAAS